MARPSQFNREDAVEFAMNAFWRDGYEANSIKALSEKLGITRSSFYNAFKSREGLFDEALALYMSRSPDKALKDAMPDQSVKRLFTDTFRKICAVRAADPEARGCLAVNGVAELCNTNDTLGPKLHAAMLANVTRIETILGWAIANGEIDADTDTYSLALSVKNLIVGLNVMSKLVRNEDDLWRIASTTLRALDLFEEA